jgi:alanine racemase
VPLRLYVDGDGWRAHLRAVQAAQPGLVPVVKGNGYGFGNPRLARRSAWLGVDTVAVGTYQEVADVATRFPGSILVLTPWRPSDPEDVFDPRMVHTVGRAGDLEQLIARDDRPRVVLELLTSMRRHGFSPRGLREAAARLASAGGRRVAVEGAAIHLPITAGSSLPEAERLLNDVVAAGLSQNRVYVSHLADAELASLARSYPGLQLRPRIGTRLWLGERSVLRARASVLDVHPVQRGDVYGYRGRRAPRGGTILVVSGGTGNGIGLEAPTSNVSLRSRARGLAKGGLEAAGLVRSPYVVDGRRRWFAEPPHMQVSMVFLPSGTAVPEVDDEVDVRVRFTTTLFDETLLS